MSVFASVISKVKDTVCPVRPWRVKVYLTAAKAQEYGKGEAGYYYENVEARTSRGAESMIRKKYGIRRGLVVADKA